MNHSAGNRAIGFILVAIATGWGCTETPRTVGPDPLEWVEAGLLSKNKEVRKQAFAYCRTNWTQAKSRFAELLKSDVLAERMAGAYVFSRLGSKSDLPALRRCLTDASRLVQLTAVRGVQRLGDRESAPHLVAMLAGDLNYLERRATLRALAGLDPVATGTLCARLARHEGWAQRRNAAETMGLLDDNPSRDLLLRMLDDPVWMVRIDAAEALAHRRVPAARDHLLTMTRDELPKIRAAAVRYLTAFGHAEDLDLVAQMSFEDKAKIVRIAATAALGDFPEPVALPLVARVLRKAGEHRKVRFAAVRALRRYPGAAARELARTTVAADHDLQALVRLQSPGPAQPGKE
jgi:HEAT repeat protein